MSEVRIDVLWTLMDLSQPPDRWELYVNHIVLFDSARLRDMFYSSGHPNIPVNEPVLLAQLQVLVREAKELVPPVRPVVDSGFTFQPVGQLSYLTHYPGGRMSAEVKDVNLLTWTRPLSLGNRPYQSDTGEIQIVSLSETARAAIKQLDGLAVECAYRRYADTLQKMTEVDPATLPSARKIRAFLAYRTSHRDAAAILHRIMTEYAHGTAFSPYLNTHNMHLGDWREQLYSAIDQTEIFVPIVTNDYAQPGSVSYDELDRGCAVAASRGIAEFFAPIFIGHHVGPTWLRAQHGVVLDTPADISPDNRDIQQLLRTILTSVLSRG